MSVSSDRSRTDDGSEARYLREAALRTPSGCGLSRRSAVALEDAGLGVMGVLTASQYDALVPEAWRTARLLPQVRSVCVVASAGRALDRALGVSPITTASSPDPVDDHTRRALDEAAAALADEGWPTRSFLYTDRAPLADEALLPGGPSAGGAFVDLVALGGAAGLGQTGRLRLLLHPVYGPWISIRGLLVSRLVLAPTAALEDFDPCNGCPAPCASACPGGALDAGELALDVCVDTRLLVVAGCAERCAARHACVLGQGHAYSESLDAHFARTSLRLAKEARSRAGSADQ